VRNIRALVAFIGDGDGLRDGGALRDVGAQLRVLFDRVANALGQREDIGARDQRRQCEFPAAMIDQCCRLDIGIDDIARHHKAQRHGVLARKTVGPGNRQMLRRRLDAPHRNRHRTVGGPRIGVGPFGGAIVGDGGQHDTRFGPVPFCPVEQFVHHRLAHPRDL
jgi:hypothetical protein